MYKMLILLAVAAFVISGASSVKAQNNSTQTKDKKLKIIKKPAPFTDGRCSEDEGTTIVRATFDKSGKVTAVEMVRQSACSYFNEQALKKAREIKFEPQIENGEAVTVVKTIQYQFTKR